MQQSHSRVLEAQKSSHRLSPAAFRSGCYKRAITILQNETGDYSGRDATASSLYCWLTNANRKMASKAPPSSPGQRETAPSQHQNPSAKEKLQDKLEVKVIKEQLRRERQEQRHEQNKQLWQRRHKEKVRLRHQDLAARIRQQEEDRKEQLYKHEQQQKLVQHLEDRKQNSADQDAADPVSVESDTSAAPQQQLLQVRQLRSKAEVQLALAHQVGEHMSSRAASIEPADGECTPSPGAMQQAKTAAKHSHQLSAPVVQA
ncbi:TPA: hypothetical protein ACH3X1_001133 [Trebouxia sp. C0004]